MDNRGEVRDFLTTRRARITPEQAGLPDYGGKRRVPGLRRTEVAALAGERRVLHAARTRQPDRRVRISPRGARRGAAARRSRRQPVRPRPRREQPRPRRPASQPAQIRPSIYRILDALTAPAYIRNARMDILAANPLCYALYAGILTPQTLPLNLARFLFLDPRAPEFFVEWDTVADDTAAAVCAPKPAAARATATSPTSSANSPPAATSSAPAGPGTTSGCTARHPNASATPLWARCS